MKPQHSIVLRLRKVETFTAQVSVFTDEHVIQKADGRFVFDVPAIFATAERLGQLPGVQWQPEAVQIMVHPQQTAYDPESQGSPTLRQVDLEPPSTPSLHIGDRVIKNEATWRANEFDQWGRGAGVGVVVEPPFLVADVEMVDVRWPAGRCFEAVDGLVLSGSNEP